MKKRIMTETMIFAFEDMLINDEKSSNTISKYKRDLFVFLQFANNREITKTLLLEYKATLEETYALTSANSMIAALNSFLKFIGWPDLCIKQFKIQRAIYCSENNELTKQEYISLVHTAEKRQNKRLSLLIQTVCATGIRISELKFVTIEAVRCGEAVVSCKGKSRKVFLVSALCKKLLRYAKERHITSGAVFVTRSGKPVNRSNIWREMKALCRQAGVNSCKVFPHNLRHLFARTFYTIERDIAKLADILGHSSINTTRIYIVSTGREHRRQINKMCLII